MVVATHPRRCSRGGNGHDRRACTEGGRSPRGQRSGEQPPQRDRQRQMTVLLVRDDRCPHRPGVARCRHDTGSTGSLACVDVDHRPKTAIAPRRSHPVAREAPSTDRQIPERVRELHHPTMFHTAPRDGQGAASCGKGSTDSAWVRRVTTSDQEDPRRSGLGPHPVARSVCEQGQTGRGSHASDADRRCPGQRCHAPVDIDQGGL